MQRFALILICMMVVAPGRTMPSSQVQEAITRDQWKVAEGEDGDQPLVVRFRSELRTVEDVSGYPHLLLVNWNYESDERGMPKDSELESIDDFEDLLTDALEKDFQSALVCVITTEGSRQWVFYSSSVDEAAVRINAMPQKEKPYPIELLADDDEEWMYFKDNILGECADDDLPEE
ncbi:MAG: DUF695 domain-containing protein [Planctomycetota bacterium]|nr:MAG: DUF695 domain-containing protein [Planctomycetota bacterium]